MTSTMANHPATRHHDRVGLPNQDLRRFLLSSNGSPQLTDEHTETPQQADAPASRVAAVLYPRMAMRGAIADMREKVNEDSAIVIDEGLLDAEGFSTA
jgi:hypothetical protein